MEEANVQHDIPSSHKQVEESNNTEKNKTPWYKSWWNWLVDNDEDISSNEYHEELTSSNSSDGSFSLASTEDDVDHESDIMKDPIVGVKMLDRWCIKVIGGLSMGVFFDLTPGYSYIVGTDVNKAHVLLRDFGVSKSHAILSVAPDASTCILKDLGSKNGTSLNGVSLSLTKEYEIRSNDIIECGFARFVLIDRLSPMNTAIMSALGMGKSSSGGLEEGIRVTAASATMRASNHVRDIKIDVDSAISIYILEQTKKLLLQILPIASFVIATLGVLLMTGTVCYKVFNPTVQLVEQTYDLESHISEILKSFASIDYVLNNTSKTILLSGHVSYNKDIENLFYKLADLPVWVKICNEVIVDERIAQELSELFMADKRWQILKIICGQPGELYLVGYVDSHQTVDAALEYIGDMQYSCRVLDRTISEEVISGKINSILKNHGFYDIKFVSKAGYVVLTGNVLIYKGDEYNNMIKELEIINGIRDVQDLVIKQNTSVNIIDITNFYKISGVISHPSKGKAFVVNKRIYTVGDVLDGMTITNIDADKIYLQKKDTAFYITFTTK